MSMITEFKKFAMRGNVVDMAVGIVMGVAFGKIVASLVQDVIMPPIGILLGGIDFSDLMITLKNAAGDAPAVVIKYGVFINSIIEFIIIAFIVIKGMNALKRKEEAAPSEPPKPSNEEVLLTEIRDALRSR